jgi:hypothetical protein
VSESAISSGNMVMRMRWVLSTSARCGKWVAVEAYKATVLTVAMKAIEGLFDQHVDFKPITPAQEAAAAIQAFAGAMKIITEVVTGWHNFVRDHLRKKRMYGVIRIHGLLLYRFEMFVRRLALTDQIRKTVIVAVAEVKKKKNPETLLAQRPVFQRYAKEVLGFAVDIDQGEFLMKKDGLRGRSDEVRTAYQAILVG